MADTAAVITVSQFHYRVAKLRADFSGVPLDHYIQALIEQHNRNIIAMVNADEGVPATVSIPPVLNGHAKAEAKPELPRVSNGKKLHRVDFVRELLRQASAPMTKAEIMAAMKRAGQKLPTQANMDTMLSYYTRAGVFKRVSTGVYTIGKKS